LPKFPNAVGRDCWTFQEDLPAGRSSLFLRRQWRNESIAILGPGATSGGFPIAFDSKGEKLAWAGSSDAILVADLADLEQRLNGLEHTKSRAIPQARRK
jgi:hypothetical protein